MKTRILIATSEGPSEIQSLVPEDPDVACAVCLNGSTEALPITRGYHAFVRKPTGVIERMTGHKSYRMDVSASITNGESWQLGVYLAHALMEKNELAMQGEAADQVWLVTGAVNARDEAVHSVSHIQQKLNYAADLLKELKAKGAKVGFVLPVEDMPQLENDFDIPAFPVEIASEMVTDARKYKVPTTLDTRKNKQIAFGGVGIVMLAAGSVFAYQTGYLNQFIYQDRPEEVIFAPTKEDLEKAEVKENITPIGPELDSNMGETDTIVAGGWATLPDEDAIASETNVKDMVEVAGQLPQQGEMATQLVKPNQLEDQLSFQLFEMKTADGGSCAGRKYRDTSLTVFEIKAAFDQDWQDDPDVCGLRVLMKNLSDNALAFSISVTSDNQDVIRKRDVLDNDKVVSLDEGQEFTYEMGLSLFRSGNYDLAIVATDANSDVSITKNISAIGWTEEASAKFQ
ncbi:hypothetical protein [Curvivirga aplysinae]|uniref:hypothetical protein n=1 Tax=Curvivirga aplysinae TaxID=2529852 RepID=UPI0012BB4D5B|nr:hypothetical protein [Curvivirga aplysinae]MTI08727.1 hypothetical protein [Curvivirga aplysinae]